MLSMYAAWRSVAIVRSSEDVYRLVQAKSCGPELTLAQPAEDLRCVAPQQ